MQIEVTKEDIKGGVRFSIHNCPLARAIRRKCPETYVEVTNNHIEIGGRLYGVNKGIVRFIDDFDYGKSVQPKRFRIKPIH